MELLKKKKSAVNATTSGNQTDPSVVELSDGKIAVTWQSTGIDGSDWAIVSRVFSSSLASPTSEYTVNTTTTNSQHLHVALKNGGYVIV